ncbi:MAG TPA: isoamylase early set domain-containing protein [Desulfatiglandales bacterium]|nr:isoamylase early set domain-containing protein [Desulfatiglandales bacterium]
MATTSPKTKSDKRRVIFSLKAPTANKVSVGGDFNNWDAIAHPMKKDQDGVWKKTLMLSPARYEYKFLVDGQWRNDPKNDVACPNRFGTQNNVIDVL